MTKTLSYIITLFFFKKGRNKYKINNPKPSHTPIDSGRERTIVRNRPDSKDEIVVSNLRLHERSYRSN